MVDLFLKDDCSRIIRNKFIVIIGDSIQRSIYKDMVRLLQDDRYLNDRELRTKGEPKFANDECLVGRGGMHNGVTCREVRQYCTDYHLLRYYYVTRCYNTYMESVLNELSVEPYPDVIIMNSCIWDITRYGSDGINQYKRNMPKLLDRIERIIKKESLFIWLATLPVSESASGGVIAADVECVHDRRRLDIIAANAFNHRLAVDRGLDFLDLHYLLRRQIHRRAEDGIHWDMTAHRRITNAILGHVAVAWGVTLPGHAAPAYDDAVGKASVDVGTMMSPVDMLETVVNANYRTIKKAKRRVTPKKPNIWKTQNFPMKFNTMQPRPRGFETARGYGNNNNFIDFNTPQAPFNAPCPLMQSSHDLANTINLIGFSNSQSQFGNAQFQFGNFPHANFNQGQASNYSAAFYNTIGQFLVDNLY